MENNLKEKMISTGILWKWYQKQAWEMGKSLMHSKLYFDQMGSNMQEGKVMKKGWFLSWLSAGMNELKKKKKGEHTRGFWF